MNWKAAAFERSCSSDWIEPIISSLILVSKLFSSDNREILYLDMHANKCSDFEKLRREENGEHSSASTWGKPWSKIHLKGSGYYRSGSATGWHLAHSYERRRILDHRCACDTKKCRMLLTCQMPLRDHVRRSWWLKLTEDIVVTTTGSGSRK